MIVIDDTELGNVILVVTFLDHVERWGPAPRGYAELVAEQLPLDPPQGFLSAVIEEPKEEGRSADEDDHFYGAWSGGKKSEGGHPEGEKGKAAKGSLAGKSKTGADLKPGDAGYAAAQILGNRLEITYPIAADRLEVWDEIDSALVSLDAMAKNHPNALEALVKNDHWVVINPRSAGEYFPDLAGQHPRGYSAPATYEDCAGLFKVEAVGATVFIGDTVQHGSQDVVGHEIGHALDHIAGYPSTQSGDFESSFNRQWSAAVTEMGSRISPYYRQMDGAGSQEMFAEAFAIQTRYGQADVQARFGRGVADWMEEWVKKVVDK